MNTYGLSIIEIRHLIESSLLPDKCICECSDGTTLTIRIMDPSSAQDLLLMTGIEINGLQTSRAIAALIIELRESIAMLKSNESQTRSRQSHL